MIVLIGIIGIMLGAAISWQVLRKVYSRNCDGWMYMSDKHLEMFLSINAWFYNELKGKQLAAYLRENSFYNISIYGIGYIGKTLYEYLKKEDFQINNLIDQNRNSDQENIKIRTLDDKQAPTDIVIVTALYYFEELEIKLEKVFSCPIVSFADIIYKV